MHVQQWPIERLKEYERNPRKNDHAIDKMAAQITAFGFRVPIIAKSDGEVVDGHLRLKAARQLGITEVPIIVADDLTEAQIQAFRIAVNRSAEWAEWDSDLLIGELQSLELSGFDLSIIDFDLDDLLRAQKVDGKTDPEVAPEPPAVPTSQLGDLWLLGGHRVLCGDATDAKSVACVVGDHAINLMVTDPPYGVEYDADWRNRAERANGKPYGASAVGTVQNDKRADWREAWGLFGGNIAYCWHADRHASAVQQSLESVGFEIRSQIIWAKPRFVISRGDYHWQHEPCWYAVRNRGNWTGDRSQTTLWQIDHMKSETGHSTQKPIECMARPIRNNSKPGDYIYDPFLGSGTSVIAATIENRKCIGMEIDPAYVDVIVTRWEAFTGQSATLDGDGRTFSEIAKSRTKKRRRSRGDLAE